MDQIAVWSRMIVKPGKERELEEFLSRSKLCIDDEVGTTSFYALKGSDGEYNTVATFRDEASYQAHLHGEVPKLLEERAEDFFASPVEIFKTDVLAAKTS